MFDQNFNSLGFCLWENHNLYYCYLFLYFSHHKKLITSFWKTSTDNSTSETEGDRQIWKMPAREIDCATFFLREIGSFHLFFLEWVKLEKRNVRLIDKSSSLLREITQRGFRHQVTSQATRQCNDPVMNTITFFLFCSVVLCTAITSPEYFCSWQLICSPKSRIKRLFLHVSPGTAAYRECTSVCLLLPWPRQHLDIMSK